VTGSVEIANDTYGPSIDIAADPDMFSCTDTSIDLTASGADTYERSTSDTTNSITVMT